MYKSKNTLISMYTLSHDLCIPPLAGICASQQLKCYLKWRSSNCIINDLIKFIPPMTHYSWTKESNSLRKRLFKKNIKNIKEVKENY